MKRVMLGLSFLVVPPILACGGGAGDATTAAPAPAVPVPAVAIEAPAPVVVAAPSRPPPWAGLRPADPFETLTSRCASFGSDGKLSAYEDAPHMFINEAEGTWTRDGDQIAMAWTTTHSSYVDAPEDTPEDELDEDGKVWVESESKASVTLRLLAAWEKGEPDDGKAAILATTVDPTCAECRTVIWCTGYASHEGGENGDTWFGPADTHVWAQVIDAGGGAAAVDEVGVLADPHLAFVFPGDPAKTPRTGIEVLHQEGPRATEAAAKIAVTLGVLSTNVRTVPWADAPHPVVIAVGPPDKWNPDGG